MAESAVEESLSRVRNFTQLRCIRPRAANKVGTRIYVQPSLDSAL